ncbi:MAG: lipoprotein [Candidatus Abyssubacteria bacterium]
MAKKIIALLLCLALISPVFVGCESVGEEHRGAAVGAGVGAGAGAITGALIGDDLGGAVVGGLIGAVVGGVIGHYAYDQQRDSSETRSVYNYETTKGTVLNIEDATPLPRTVHQGETVDLRMTYAVLTPYPDNRISITEIREITYQGELVGRPHVDVQYTDGTYTSTIPLQLPADAKTGQYRVKYIVQSAGASDTQEATFEVGRASIPAYPPAGGTQ